MIKVENHKNLYRDEKSGAIINCDTHGYSQYKKMKASKNNERREIDNGNISRISRRRSGFYRL